MDILKTIGSLFSRPQGQGAVSDSTAAVNNQTKASGSSSDFLGNFAKTLMGTPDMDMTPEDMKDRTNRRKQAGSLAQSAMEDPGEIPAVGNSGSGFGLQDLVSIVKKLF